MMRFWAALILVAGSAATLSAQPNETVRIHEAFTKNARYHVSCQVEITGTLTPAANAKDANPKPIKVSGRSAIEYDERILNVTADRKIDRTVRHYRQLVFDRKVGEEEQHSKLRPEASRLVILRHNQFEVPFCPTGPLLWSEIDLVRTDVFAPALAGLFPDGPVKVGAKWRADNVAVQELTDVEKITKADIICTFDKIATLLGRRNAHVNFEGKVEGVGEDGNAQHELRGSYYVDLDANFLSYVYVKGIHHLVDKNGRPTGKIEGTFVMTRTPTLLSKEVDDDALRGLTLEPNSENTMLLFEHAQVGVRFSYPRNWHIAGFNEKQIGIDEKRGGGVLVTIAPAASTPTGAQFLQETKQWLIKEKAKVFREDKAPAIVGNMEAFAFDAEVAKERVYLQYYVMRQANLGVTVTARLLPAELIDRHREVERMAKSMQLRVSK